MTNDIEKTRPTFEAAVIERLKESGFLEVEIRVECFKPRVGDGYADEVINAGWHYWKAALSQPAADGWLPTHRHKKRGSTYQVVAEGKLQVDGDLDNESVVIYRGEDGEHWVRPAYEFNDGRFEALPASGASE